MAAAPVRAENGPTDASEITPVLPGGRAFHAAPSALTFFTEP